MTEAARCEVCGWLRGYGRGLCSAHIPDYYDYEISACFKRGFERLKAENASLLGSLRAAEKDVAEVQAAREWIFNKTWVGGGTRPLSFLTASHEQMQCERAAAELRNTELTGLLREALAGFQWGGSAKALDFAVRARAALHDEERRPRDYDPITAPIPEGDMNGPHGPLHTPDDEERSAPPQEGEK